MLAQIKQMPLVLPLRKAMYERKFATHSNVHYFRGVFNSFEDAYKSAPKTKPKGYDNTAAAKMYKERTERFYSTDYPVLFWLSKILGETHKVFDFGGHIGIHFYSYQKVLDFKHIEKWTVCDVEAVCEEGRDFAASKKVQDRLNFVTDIASCEGYDLFLAKGSLQYLEWELHDKLANLNKKPKYLIINTTPLHPKHKTITLNSIGTSFCPYHLRVEKDFFDGLKSLGYAVLDSWKNEEKSCNIAFEPERSLSYYTGAILQLS
jgi:putative methyltransferase (TIGR04325 family)